MNRAVVIGVIFLFVASSVIPISGFKLEQSTTPITSGNTLYVGGSGEGNYTKIQDAIDNASDGDTVFVYNGTYYENLVVDKSINLIGENRNTTVIDGNMSGDVVNITADWVNICGFTIQNDGSDPYVGIILQSNNNNISYSIISNNWIGVYLHNFSSNIITGNTISNNEHGVYIIDSSNNIVTSNNITHNNEPGIHISNFSYNNTIRYNYIVENDGDGISVKSSNNTISHNYIIDNFLYGIRIYSSDNTISYNDIVDNGQCGIRLYSSNNNIIHGNNISENPGWAGIFLKESCNNNIISDNDISQCGDTGISLEYNCSNNIISGNNIRNNEGWWSLGIHFIDSNDNSITNNIISKHTDEGMHIDGSYNCNISGNIVFDNKKGIWFDGSSGCSINQNIVLNNTKAGIEFLHNSIDNSIIRNTISKNKYGISSFENNITITGNNISNNERGISVVGNKIAIIDNNIQNNDLGLLIGSWKGVVRKNNFIGNRRHTMFRVPNLLWRNTWDSNYWDNWIGIRIPMFQEFPKVIFGNLGLLGFIPWIYFDWHPAQEPYDLEV